MLIQKDIIVNVMMALLLGLIVSFLATPLVRRLAFKIGAVDIPRDNRRMHDHPIPRLGGLAIFLGFLVSVLTFANIDMEMQGILIGAVIIVVLGIADDIHSLPAKFKFVVQIVAALCAVLHGVGIHVLSNPIIFSDEPYWVLGGWSIPISVLWIVAITNAVNLIDGLDGLADGISTIAAMTMLILALALGEWEIALICGALVGACVGFLPYNMNPARIFMGDTGSTFLGFILACVSIQGLFKYYAIISFLVPFIILGLPIFDTASAIIRRILKGQSPMVADRSHIHHKLIDMGLNQKQAVSTLYIVSGVLGLSAVLLTTSGGAKAALFILALIICAAVAIRSIWPHHPGNHSGHGAPDGRQGAGESAKETAGGAATPAPWGAQPETANATGGSGSAAPAGENRQPAAESTRSAAQPEATNETSTAREGSTAPAGEEPPVKPEKEDRHG